MGISDNLSSSTLSSTLSPSSGLSDLVTAIILCIIFGTLIFLSLTGNLLVTFAIIYDRSLRKQENLFLASLAISDILVAAAVMTFAAVNDILGHWIFGNYCIIWISSDVMCSTASILNLAAISFDRYWHIKAPMKYNETITRNKITIVIISIWLVSASISFIPIGFELHIPPEKRRNAASQQQYSDILPKLNSTIDSDKFNSSNIQDHIATSNASLHTQECILDLNPIYALVSSSVSFFFPCAIMIIAYSRLYFFARYHVKVLRNQYKSIGLMLMAVPGVPASYKSRLADKHTEFKAKQAQKVSNAEAGLNDQKARVTIGIIMGVFLACWLPFFCVNIFQALCNCIPPKVFKTVSWIGYANSSANPIIYSIFSRDFRLAFKKILRCQPAGNRYMGVATIAGTDAPVGYTPLRRTPETPDNICINGTKDIGKEPASLVINTTNRKVCPKGRHGTRGCTCFDNGKNFQQRYFSANHNATNDDNVNPNKNGLSTATLLSNLPKRNLLSKSLVSFFSFSRHGSFRPGRSSYRRCKSSDKPEHQCDLVHAHKLSSTIEQEPFTEPVRKSTLEGDISCSGIQPLTRPFSIEAGHSNIIQKASPITPKLHTLFSDSEQINSEITDISVRDHMSAETPLLPAYHSCSCNDDMLQVHNLHNYSSYCDNTVQVETSASPAQPVPPNVSVSMHSPSKGFSLALGHHSSVFQTAPDNLNVYRKITPSILANGSNRLASVGSADEDGNVELKISLPPIRSVSTSASYKLLATTPTSVDTTVSLPTPEVLARQGWAGMSNNETGGSMNTLNQFEVN